MAVPAGGAPEDGGGPEIPNWSGYQKVDEIPRNALNSVTAKLESPYGTPATHLSREHSGARH